jgi:hypothetical protein
MKGAVIRKWHRRMGIWLVLLILLQATTGLILTLEERSETDNHAYAKAVSSNIEQSHHDDEDTKVPEEEHGLVGMIHHSGGLVGLTYRLVIGIGMIGMAVSGIVIFLQTVELRKT